MSTSHPTIGIIGGFGPDTSASFCVQLVKFAHTIRPDHPPAFVVDFVSVSPALAGKAINGSREAGLILVQSINASIARLQSIGVSVVAMPCNTLHLFADIFQVPPPLRFLHIVDTVLEELLTKDLRRIGLLGTQLTVASRLYADRCAAAGIDCMTPSKELQEQLNTDIELFVRTGTVSGHTADLFRKIFSEFEQAGIAAVVLGCTDLSGMLKRAGVHPSLPCIDSMEVLAKACATLCA